MRRGRGPARHLPRAAEPRRRPLPPAEQALARRRSRRAARSAQAYAQAQVNDIWRTLPQRADRADDAADAKRFPAEPQENLLYFIEKNAPLLEPWQREVVRIVRKIAQYFYPQRQTQVMNEGWATFWHHQLLNTLYDEGHLTDGVMIEWLKSHTNVIFQPPVGHPRLQRHQSLRARLRDVHRHPAHLREPDRRGPRVVPATSPARRGCRRCDHAMRNFKDESFIGQYLSPKLIRDLRLFAILDDEHDEHLRGLGDPRRPRATAHVRESLSRQYDLGSREPNIQVWSVNLRGDRSLTLRHTRHNNRPLHDGAQEVLKHVARLWGFGVHLESVDAVRRRDDALVDHAVRVREDRLARPRRGRPLPTSERSGRERSCPRRGRSSR